MANKNIGNLLSISPALFSQLVLALFLTLVFLMIGTEPSLSIFLGALGGLALGWMTNASKTAIEPPTIASSDGIDAGLKYWLFFMLGFWFLGYLPPMSILLGAVAGLGGGWIIAWWGSKEESRYQLPDEASGTTELELPSQRAIKRQRKQAPRYRRPRGSINFKFWER